MPSRSAVALLVLAAVLVGATAMAPPAAGYGPPGPIPAGENAGAQPTTSTSTATAEQRSRENATLPPSEVTYHLQLQPDGDARWRISMTLPVRDANESRAFERLVADFEASESPLGLDSFRRYEAAADAANGRDMEIRNVERSHSRENGTGTLAVSFTWTNFARVDGNRLAVGDAFNTTSGTWLTSIRDHSRLVIAPPDGYGVSDAPQVGFNDRAAVWEGPYTFDGREPWIVYSGDAPPPTTTAEPGNTTVSPGGSPPGTGTGTPPGGGPFSSALPFVLLVVLAGVSATLAVRYVRTDDDGGLGPIGGVLPGGDGGSDAGAAEPVGGSGDPSGNGSVPDDAVASGGPPDSTAGADTAGAGDATTGGTGTAGAEASGAAAGSAEAGSAETGGAETGGAEAGSPGVGGTDASGAEPGRSGASEAGAAVSAGDEVAAGTDAGATGEADAADEIDETLLSDEERVERLLEHNGGRMKQASIVKETGWSNAKVSQLLSAMAEDDRVDKLRIGRENLISFPDEDVTDIDSE